MRAVTRRTTGRSRGRGLMALATATAVLILVFAMSAGLFVLTSNDPDALASLVRPQPGALPWNPQDSASILLIGTSPASDPATTTMEVVSYHPSARTLDVVSIPDNLWVTIPGYGQDRIAQSYYDGGPRLALLTVQSVLRVPIRYYAAARPDVIRRLTDAFGRVRLPARNATAMANGAAVMRYVDAAGTGSNHLETSIAAEQTVLLALVRRATSASSLFRVSGLVSTLGGSISTNFPYGQIPVLVSRLALVPSSRTYLTALDPAHGAASPYRTSGEDVLLPNWTRVTVLSRRWLNSSHPSYQGRVVVLNGAGIAGEAASLSGSLRADGIPVRSVGSSRHFNYPATEVRIGTHARSGAVSLARDVADLVQARLIVTPSDHSSDQITVIIGGDFQDLTQQ